jgi:methyltransferase
MTRPPAWYLGLIAVQGMQRLGEMRRSRTNEKWTHGAQAARRSFPLMVAVHVGMLTLPLLEVGLRGRRPRIGPGSALWIGVLGGAWLLRRWSIQTLGKRWNALALVPYDLEPATTGPYRHIRHPNYLAVILEFLALPLAGGAWISAIGLSLANGLVLVDRIRSEERLLDRVPAYRRVFGDKARFIPGVF